MSTADFETWGIAHYQRGQNAFQAVPPKSKKVGAFSAPKKRGPKTHKPKVQQAAISLETPEERRARQFKERQQKAIDQRGRVTVDLAPRTAGSITIPSQAEMNRNRAIRAGRAI